MIINLFLTGTTHTPTQRQFTLYGFLQIEKRTGKLTGNFCSPGNCILYVILLKLFGLSNV